MAPGLTVAIKLFDEAPNRKHRDILKSKDFLKQSRAHFPERFSLPEGPGLLFGALIIETRSIPGLGDIIRQHLMNLPKDWGLTVIGSISTILLTS